MISTAGMARVLAAGPALLLLIAVVHLLPEHIAAALGWRAAAVETVLYGVEAAVLWVCIGVAASSRLVAAAAVCGLFESAQRVICRPMLPMDRPLILPPGQTTCEAAGLDTAGLSVVAIAAAVFVWRMRSRDPM